jgi:hypothetical protein
LHVIDAYHQLRFFILFISLWTLSAVNAQQVSFHAQFRSLENGEGIMYARVTARGGEAKLTNINGYVELKFDKGADIIVNHLSFDSLVLQSNKFAGRDSLVFYLTPKTYVLREVSFSILGERSLFDNKFVQNDLGKSDEEKVREKLNIIDMKMELKGLDRSAQTGMVLGSPISYLYERFSKDGKERAKYAMLVEQDRLAKISLKQFDDLTVTTLTNFTDEELARFKQFCSFHPTYIKAVDALELYFEILRCRDEYVAKKY